MNYTLWVSSVVSHFLFFLEFVTPASTPGGRDSRCEGESENKAENMEKLLQHVAEKLLPPSFKRGSLYERLTFNFIIYVKSSALIASIH